MGLQESIQGSWKSTLQLKFPPVTTPGTGHLRLQEYAQRFRTPACFNLHLSALMRNEIQLISGTKRFLPAQRIGAKAGQNLEGWKQLLEWPGQRLEKHPGRWKQPERPGHAPACFSSFPVRTRSHFELFTCFDIHPLGRAGHLLSR